MNYLAHLYLSGNDPELMIGNFIADHLKGKLSVPLPARVHQGVLLHRMIDDFTDSHPLVEQSKVRLRPHFRKYATVIADIYYDHFLARDWHLYHNKPLEEYAASVYMLMEGSDVLPERARYMLKYMSEQNWLVNYAKIEGISRALKGLSKRSRFENNMAESPEFLVQHYAEFEKEFTVFFSELRLFTGIIRSR